MRFSVLVVTRDEELQIRRCLTSVAAAEEVVLIDSGSTDRTLEIAASFPRVRVVRRDFVDFSDQRNHGLTNCFAPGQWVLHLDADESLPTVLEREIVGLAPPAGVVAYNIASRTFLGGRPVLRASGYPVYQTRLTQAGSFLFEEVGHGQKAPRRYGALPRLRNAYDHEPFEKGLDHWREKHELYADKEARALRGSAAPPSMREALRDPILRRQWVKHITARLRWRPELVWVYLMFGQGGIFDGPAGWRYCSLRRTYERMVTQRLRSLPR